jgi:hypothetical protein
MNLDTREVIGCHDHWTLYRVAYKVNVPGRGPTGVEEWQLSTRREGEEG